MVSDKTHRAVCLEIIRLLQEERKRKGLSKYALSERSGVSQQMVGYVERGSRRPSLEIVVRLAAGLEANLPSIIKRAQDAVSKRKIG